YNSADVIEYMGVITAHVDMSHPVLMDKYIYGTECEVDADGVAGMHTGTLDLFHDAGHQEIRSVADGVYLTFGT
ncbi:hypothetical protein H6B10_17295, partial [Gemmiger formicilis]|nr:hypothetical protein [Gemmiger formicilis]